MTFLFYNSKDKAIKLKDEILRGGDSATFSELDYGWVGVRVFVTWKTKKRCEPLEKSKKEKGELMKMSKYFYACLLCIVFVSILVISCVKIPTEAPPLPEFKAKVRVINVAESLGAVNVSIGGEAMGSVNVGEAGAYKTIDAGTKEFTIGGVPDTLVLGTDLIGSVFVIDEAQDIDDNFVISREWSLDDFSNPALADTVAQIIVAQMSADTLDLAMTLADVGGWTHPGDRNLRFMTIDVDAGPDTLIVTQGATTVEIPLDITGATSTTVVLTGTIDDLQSFILDNALE